MVQSTSKTLVAMILVGGTLLSCQRSVPRNEHEGPIQAPTRQTDKGAEASDKNFASLTIDKTQDLSKKTSTELSVLAKNLQTFILNANYLENPKFAFTQKMQDALGVFNATLLSWNKIDHDGFLKSGILESYLNAAFSGCDLDLKGCSNTAFFKSDYRSTQVILIETDRLYQNVLQSETKSPVLQSETRHTVLQTAKQLPGSGTINSPTCRDKCQTDVFQYYRYLQYAYDIKSHAQDRALDFQYLRLARTYAEILASLPETLIQREIIRRHGETFSNVLALYTPNTEDKDFVAFIRSLRPWEFSYNKQNPFSYGLRKILSYAGKTLLYEDKQKTILSPDFKNALSSTSTQDPEAFRMILERLKKKDITLFKNLALDAESPSRNDFYDEYFFIIDRLYNGALSPEDVVEIWAGTTQNRDLLFAKIESYVQIQILSLISDTNAFLGSVYSKKEYSSLSLIKKIMDESQEISRKWQNHLQRIDNFANLIGQLYPTPDQKTRDLNLVLESTRRNVNYIAVYPQMMVLVYFMNDIDAKIQFHTWFGDFEITSNDIIVSFFDGQLSPWFRFGNESVPLDKTEMLFAFYYALNTGTFETLATDGINKATNTYSASINHHISFFKKAIKQYLTIPASDLQKSINSMRGYAEGNPDLTTFLDHCHKIENSDFNDPIRLSNFSDLRDMTVFGNGNANGLAKSAIDTFSGSGTFATEYRSIRTNLNQRITTVQAMLRIYREHLKKMGIDENQQKAILTDLNNEIQPIMALRREFYDVALKNYQTIGNCLDVAYQTELHRQSELLNEEVHHLGQAYDGLTKMQSLSGNELNTSLQNLSHTLGLTENSKSQLSQRGYTYGAYDALRRMADFSATLKPKVDVPDDSNKEQLDFYDTSTFLSLYDQNGKLVSREQFIKSGTHRLNGTSNYYVKWLDPMSNLLPYKSRLETLVELYRTGFELNVETESRVKAAEVVTAALQMRNAMNLSQQEIKDLDWLGSPRRLTVDQYDGILMSTRTSRPVSILEKSFETMTDSFLSNHESLKEARGLYLASSTVGHFFFKMDKTTDSILRETFKETIDYLPMMLKDFSAAVSEQEKRDLELTPAQRSTTVEIQNGQAISFPLLESSATHAPQYLDPRKFNDAVFSLSDFHHKQTKDFFLDKKSNSKAQDL